MFYRHLIPFLVVRGQAVQFSPPLALNLFHDRLRCFELCLRYVAGVPSTLLHVGFCLAISECSCLFLPFFVNCSRLTEFKSLDHVRGKFLATIMLSKYSFFIYTKINFYLQFGLLYFGMNVELFLYLPDLLGLFLSFDSCRLYAFVLLVNMLFLLILSLLGGSLFLQLCRISL